MLRIILGIIAGFIAWSVLWVGSDAFFSMIWAEWGKSSTDFRAAVENQTPYTASMAVLLVLLVKSVIISIISGYLTAMIARENFRSTVGLGILLLIFGVFVQAGHWDYMPLWYHVPFLLLLIPMTVLGGKLREI